MAFRAVVSWPDYRIDCAELAAHNPNDRMMARAFLKTFVRIIKKRLFFIAALSEMHSKERFFSGLGENVIFYGPFVRRVFVDSLTGS